MSYLFYRRVWQWDGAQWVVVAEGPANLPFKDGISCMQGPSYCSIPPPYISERWWKHEASTFGGSGTWKYEGDRRNWGAIGED